MEMFYFLNLSNATAEEVAALSSIAKRFNEGAPSALHAVEDLQFFPESWNLTVRMWINGEY